MAGFKTEKLIAAPPERVFAASSDFASAADTISAIEKMEVLTEGPVGVGTKFRETRKMFGKEAKETMEVTEFEPPRRYVLIANSHGSIYRSEYTFEPEGAGTRVTLSFEATPQTFMAKVLGVIFRLFLKKMISMCDADLEDLKNHVERSAAGD